MRFNTSPKSEMVPEALRTHPIVILFFLIGTLAVTELGLTAYMVHLQPSPRLSFLLFTSCWTVLGVILHSLTNLYLGSIYTLITAIFWAIGTGENLPPSNCSGAGIASLCRPAEAIGWAELVLTTLLLLVMLFQWHAGSRKDSYAIAGHRGFYV